MAFLLEGDIMRVKHNALILDTETTFKNEKPFLAYNIGGAFGDIYSAKSKPIAFDFYVEEIITDSQNFQHTYLDKETGERKFWKYDSRFNFVLNEWRLDKDRPDSKKKVKPLAEIFDKIAEFVDASDSVASYNWAFDKKAFITTCLEYQNRKWTEFDRIPNWCILDAYGNRMINANYFTMVDKEKPIYKKAFLSHSGKNYGYSAQAMARWIFDSEQYVEQHTAQDDATMEFELARHFVRKHKKDFEKTFLGHPKTFSWIKMKKKMSATAKMEARQGQLLP